jgi:dynein heavy chain
MLGLEGEIRNTLQRIIEQAVADYPTKSRQDWAFTWPAQVCIAVFQIMWTMETEEAIKENNLYAFQ